MNQNIDTLLAEQSHQLDKERQRLTEELNGLHVSDGSGDNGATEYYPNGTDGGESPEPSSVRSNGLNFDADKQHKEEMNHAISDQRSESGYVEPPRTGRRFVRPPVRISIIL